MRVAPRSGRPPRFSRQNAIRVRIANILALLALVALYAGCAGPLKGLYPPPEGDPVKWAYVVSHGWHTGIVVRREDIADGIWPEHPDFAPSEYVEVGWGDRAFYQAPEGTVGLALKALFWPTSSVLHIAGFSGPVEDMVSGSDIVAIGLSGRGFEKLILFVQAAYAKDESGRAIPLGPGQYGNSRFYLARGRYHLMNTCNNWTARALRSAGVPITPLYAVTAGNVMYQAGRSGWVIRAKYP